MKAIPNQAKKNKHKKKKMLGDPMVITACTMNDSNEHRDAQLIRCRAAFLSEKNTTYTYDASGIRGKKPKQNKNRQSSSAKR